MNGVAGWSGRGIAWSRAGSAGCRAEPQGETIGGPVDRRQGFRPPRDPPGFGRAAGGTTAQMEMSSPLVGRPAAPFELPDADGRLHGLGEYRGRWLLLVMHRHLF